MDQVERDVDDFIAIGGQGTTLEENRIIDFSEEGVDLVGASIEDARLAMLGRSGREAMLVCRKRVRAARQSVRRS